MKTSPVLTLLFSLFVLLHFTSCKKSGETTDQPARIPPVMTTGKSYYVSAAGGSETNTGLSVAAPFKTIEAGINAAAAGTPYL